MDTLVVPLTELGTRFDELLALADAHTTVILVEHPDGRQVRLIAAPKPGQRPAIIGLHPNSAVLAPDFHAELPSEAWGGAFD